MFSYLLLERSAFLGKIIKLLVQWVYAGQPQAAKTKLLLRARALGLALNSSEKCQMCKFHNIPANYVHQALLCMLATVTQILPVPDSFKLLEIIYGYKFDSFFHIYSPFSIGYNIPSFFQILLPPFPPKKTLHITIFSDQSYMSSAKKVEPRAYILINCQKRN